MSTHRITIDLPESSYELLRRAVDSGEYPSESDAILHAVEGQFSAGGFDPESPEFDRWMRDVVLPADDEYRADPSSGLTPEELRASLASAVAELRSKS